MTADREFKGRNDDKAVELAAKTLHVSIDDIRYEILSHGSTCIFGLAGVKKARIWVHPSSANNTPSRLIEPEALHEEAQEEPDEAGITAPENTDAPSVGEGVLRRMVEAISPEADIVVEEGDKWVRFEVVGGRSGVLIGKRGQTLEALQLIVEKAVRRINGHELRLQVDVEGYLAKKRAGLERNAQRLAQKVADKGTPGSLGYLSAQDRRTIHLALKENPDVRTQSVGDGPMRKLMVYPRKRTKGRP